MAKYLEISFGDNDFGSFAEKSLTKIWRWVHKNNNHLLGWGHTSYNGGKPLKSLAQIFQNMHKQGALLPAIERTFWIEYLHGTVEYSTRGAYWDNHDFGVISPLSAKEIERPWSVNISVHFRNSDSFKNKWMNGEHAYLNLETGECATF